MFGLQTLGEPLFLGVGAVHPVTRLFYAVKLLKQMIHQQTWALVYTASEARESRPLMQVWPGREWSTAKFSL